MMSLATGDLKYLTSDMTLRMEIAWRSAPDRVALGKLADMFDLRGSVPLAKLKLLVAGKDPKTGKAIVRGARGLVVREDGGELKDRVERREGWDATISAPKSVSEAALIGGDERLLTAHREAVAVTLAEGEKFATARTNSQGATVLTENLFVVQFEHHTSRPVEGFVAPQLHTHNLIINMTQVGEGKYQALEPRGIYEAQHYLTTLYRAALAERVLALGYGIEMKESGAWELAGYDPAYLAALSPRSAQRDFELARKELSYSPMAARYAVLQTRKEKQTVDPDTLMESWQEKARAYRANEWRPRGEGPVCLWVDERDRRRLVAEAVTHAVAVTMARTGRSDELTILTAALKFDLGRIPLPEAKAELAGRIALGEVIVQEPPRPGKLWSMMTTPEHERLWAEIVRRATAEVTNSSVVRDEGDRPTAEWEASVRAARTCVTQIEGWGEMGMTVGMAAARTYQADGFHVVGVSNNEAVRLDFKEKGFEASNLAGAPPRPAKPTVFLVAADAVTDIGEFAAFLRRVRPDDRVVVVHDRNHENDILDRLSQEKISKVSVGVMAEKRNDRALAAARLVSKGNLTDGLAALIRASRVVEIADPEDRVAAFVQSFQKEPEKTLGVSADVDFRRSATDAIRRELALSGAIGQERMEKVLTPRADLCGDQRADATRYTVGDVVEYQETSAYFSRGERVKVVDTRPNQIVVEKECGERVPYDPRRLRGVTVYREESRAFALGDRVLVAREGAERHLAIIERLDEVGATLRPSKTELATVEICWSDRPVIDHGYVVDRVADLDRPDVVLVEVSGANAQVLEAVGKSKQDAFLFVDDTSCLKGSPDLGPGGEVTRTSLSFLGRECPNGSQLAISLRINRLVDLYDGMHQTMTGEAYSGKSFSESNLSLLSKEAEATGKQTQDEYLDTLTDQVRRAAASTPVEQARFLRGVMVADDVPLKNAEQKLMPALLETVRSVPTKRQTELAVRVMDRMLERGGYPRMTAPEQEAFAKMLDHGSRQGRNLFDEVGKVESFRSSFGLAPENDREAVLAGGLLTGDLDGFPTHPNLEIGQDLATKGNAYLKDCAAMRVLLLAGRLEQENARLGIQGEMRTGQRLFLTVDSHGLTPENWRTLTERAGPNVSLRVVFEGALTRADRDLLKDAARRDPSLQIGTVKPLGNSMQLKLNTGTIDIVDAPKRDFHFGPSL